MSVRKFRRRDFRELRRKSKADLLDQVEKTREELHQLRVAQVSGGAPAKVAQIRTTRKNINRLLTIISQITRKKLREEYARQGNKLLPLDLRPSMTRKERLRLPKHLATKKTPREKRRIRKFPNRKFAVINPSVRLPDSVVKANVKAVLSKKSDSRYRHYIIKKQKAMRFINKHQRHSKYMQKWDDTWKPKAEEEKKEEKKADQ